MRRAVKWLLERRAAGLFLDPGMGKTSISYAALKVLKSNGLLSKALVIAPLRPAVSTWPQEQMKWTDFHGLRVVVLHGRHKEALLQEDADVYVINPEGLEWLMQVTKSKTKTNKTKVAMDMRRWKKLGFNVLILDELSKYKNKSSNRSKILDLCRPKFEYCWGLTGSPSSNGLMDLFGQMYLLDMGQSLGQYITHFRAAFFTAIDNEGYNWELKPGADDLIHARVAPICLSLTAEDYLQLPEIVEVPVRIDLPPAVRDQYDSMEDELFAALDSGELITAGAAGAAYGKCRQIASGAMYRNKIDTITGLPIKGDAWVKLHDEKLEALLDLMDELQGAQVLIAYDFGHDLTRILAALPKGTPYIGSGVSVKTALQIEKDWNAGRLQYLLGHPQSMGHGLNLQGSNAHHIAWFSQNPNFELYDQFNRRLKRSGNTAARLFVYKLIARNTVDEMIVRDLRAKHRVQANLMSALKAYQKGRSKISLK